MKKKSVDPEYNKFKTMALQLLGYKVFCEYMIIGLKFNSEPENFFEEWVKYSVVRPDDDLKKWVWRYFMSNLFEYRRVQKL